MINADRLVKFGRTGQVMEFIDDLQVNDFYNNSGVLETNVHGKFSRISLQIVNKSKVENEQAHIGVFNFTVEEIKTILSLISNGNSFKDNVLRYNQVNDNEGKDYIHLMKLHNFKKNAQGKSPYFTFKLSYEENMKSAKWKFSIETGEGLAVCSEQKNGGKMYYIQKGSYVKKDLATFFISDQEIIKLKEKILNHIRFWEAASYPEMLQHRKDFYFRFKNSGYNEDTIEYWNNKPRYNQEGKQYAEESIGDVEIQPIVTEVADNYHCKKCNAKVNEKVAKYTLAVTNEVLCLNCKEEAQC